MIFEEENKGYSSAHHKSGRIDLSLMTFTDYLKEKAYLVEQHLEKLFDTDVVEPSHLRDAMRYSVLNGGKRFRPFLVLECASLFGISNHDALPVAAALECVHCYSLVHDDLPAMDDDDLRRGKPTVHIAFDEATAILAGDGLLTLSFEILSQDSTHTDPMIRTRLILELAKASGWQGMVAGQTLDLAAEDKTDLSFYDVQKIQSLKTGALIQYACQAGAILAKANDQEINALKSYGHFLGRAFQVADDLLDVNGDVVKVGKAVDKDQQAGKVTYVSLMGAKEASEYLVDLEREAIDCISAFGAAADNLVQAAKFVVSREH